MLGYIYYVKDYGLMLRSVGFIVIGIYEMLCEGDVIII